MVSAAAAMAASSASAAADGRRLRADIRILAVHGVGGGEPVPRGAVWYLMFNATTYLSSGSELLLEVLGPGIIGSLFSPLLVALPDALLILLSGLSGTRETAQQQVLIGMGLLAGSTIMLMAVLWGSCLVVGKVGLSESSSPSQHSWIGTGVATDQQTSYAVRIMVISIIPFVIVQVIDHLIQNRRIGYAKHRHI